MRGGERCRGVTNNFETGDDFIAGSYEYAGEDDLGYDLQQ